MVHLFPALVATTALLIPKALALWPNPASLTAGSQYLKLSNSFSIAYTSGSAPSDLYEAIARTEGQLRDDNMQRLVVGRGAVDAPHLHSAAELTSLKLSLAFPESKGSVPMGIMQNAILPYDERDESYTLKVPANGSPATLVANNAVCFFLTCLVNHSTHINATARTFPWTHHLHSTLLCFGRHHLHIRCTRLHQRQSRFPSPRRTSRHQP